MSDAAQHLFTLVKHDSCCLCLSIQANAVSQRMNSVAHGVLGGNAFQILECSSSLLLAWTCQRPWCAHSKTFFLTSPPHHRVCIPKHTPCVLEIDWNVSSWLGLAGCGCGEHTPLEQRSRFGSVLQPSLMLRLGWDNCMQSWSCSSLHKEAFGQLEIVGTF
jgi:hypothetical protein